MTRPLVAGCLMLVEHDLRSYQAWRSESRSGPALPAGSV